MRRSWFAVCLAVLIGGLALTGCSPANNAGENRGNQAPSTTVNPNPFAEYKPRLEGMAKVEMVVGGKSIIIELNGEAAPVTAGNFADLVQRGVYDGLAFHRVIKEPDPFVAQGGDPNGKDTNVPLSQLGVGSFVDPQSGAPRYVPLEIQLKDGGIPIYGRDRLDPSKVVLPHKKGAIAMARSQMPNSASAQFYFALADLAFLDGNYAVFGKVVEGMDVVDGIQMGDRIDSAKIIEGAENLVK